MKKIVVFLLFCLVCHAAVFAAPAYPKGRKIVQPDGTTITVYGRGNEYKHWLVTDDGTVVRKEADGFYRPVEGGVKQAAKVPQQLKPLKTMAKKNYAGANYRGLVLLVNFYDRKFSRGNEKALDFYQKMMNSIGFTSDQDPVYGPQKYTGSVRDYFYDNSNGAFDPEFDVVGPLEIDCSQYYINGVEKTYVLLDKVLRKAAETVDFSNYDSDGDGEMDMVYIIYAGYASHYEGNDERLIWPHAGEWSDYTFADKNFKPNGVKPGRFACSAEIFGWQQDQDVMPDGIGVIVHEFSHVLGYQDHYDTTGGMQEEPVAWDVMSAGCYSDDFNRTPCGYSSFEKHAAGFVEPLDITDMGGQHVTMQSSVISHDACLIRNFQQHVSFFMENRQKDKWDKNLPGHGMLVWRVDSVVPQLWEYNYVNASARACLRLVRACGTQGTPLTGVEDTDFDSFPGTRSVTELDNDYDFACLLSYDGYPSPVVLRNITEVDGVIAFDVEEDPEAEPRPITFDFPKKLYVTAEKLVGDEWVPVTWMMTRKTIDNEDVLTNFLPDTEDFGVSYVKLEDDPSNILINAQRIEKTADYSRWICNFTSVDNQGAGATNLKISRYGIPSLEPGIEFGICKMKPSAYVVSQKNITEREVVYRNLSFSEEVPSSIERVVDNGSPSISRSCKYLENGQLVILRNGRRYSVSGIELK